MIRFACPSCEKIYTVPPSSAGKSATCKDCAGRFVIPDEDVSHLLIPEENQSDAPCESPPLLANEPTQNSSPYRFKSDATEDAEETEYRRKPRRRKSRAVRDTERMNSIYSGLGHFIHHGPGKWLIAGLVALIVAISIILTWDKPRRYRWQRSSNPVEIRSCEQRVPAQPKSFIAPGAQNRV